MGENCNPIFDDSIFPKCEQPSNCSFELCFCNILNFVVTVYYELDLKWFV